MSYSKIQEHTSWTIGHTRNLKMDIVYICRPGGNEELRYSIRSIVKNLDHDSLWIVGSKPDWYSGKFIPVEDLSSKFNNIINCLKVVSESEEISDEFIFMNDDFFLLDKIDSLPVYHGGSLKDKVEEYMSIASTNYARLLSKTYEDLLSCGIKDPIDYDIHVPMTMTRSGLRKCLGKAFFPRSGYGNLMAVGGSLITDVKAYKKGSYMASKSYDPKTGSLPFISTEDESFYNVYTSILRDMFPDPSMHEIV